MEKLRKLMPSPESLQRSRWLSWLGPRLLHPRLWHMSRRGVATGVGIGVFFAFLLPVAQIPLSAGLAMMLRANIPAAVASTVVNNPFTFPPVYYAAWRVGNWMLGQKAKESEAPDFESLESAFGEPEAASAATAGGPPPQAAWWQRARHALGSVGKPLALGAFTFACVFGALGYGLVNALWRLRVVLKRRSRRRRVRAGPAR